MQGAGFDFSLATSSPSGRYVDARKEPMTFSMPTPSRTYVRKKRKLPQRPGTLGETTRKKNEDMSSVAQQMKESMFGFGDN